MAPQLIGTNGPDARGPCMCKDCATNSLPVPLSPVINAVEAEADRVLINSRRYKVAWLSPMMRGVSCGFIWIEPMDAVVTPLEQVHEQAQKITKNVRNRNKQFINQILIFEKLQMTTLENKQQKKHQYRLFFDN